MRSEITKMRKRDFSKIPSIIAIPNLLDVQLKSFDDFLQKAVAPEKRKGEGLEWVFKDIFPSGFIVEQFSIIGKGFLIQTQFYECGCAVQEVWDPFGYGEGFSNNGDLFFRYGILFVVFQRLKLLPDISYCCLEVITGGVFHGKFKMKDLLINENALLKQAH